jgi:hypothetical protein
MASGAAAPSGPEQAAQSSPPELAEASSSLAAHRQRRKCLSQFRSVRDMSVRYKRTLFTILRADAALDEHYYLPAYGLHAGEFAVYQILTEHCRKKV